MEIEEKYQETYNKMDEIVSRRRGKKMYTALGYTSNLDLLFDFKVERLNEYLEKYLVGENLMEMKVSKLINSMEDLLRTIVYYCVHGIGGEADITNTDLIFHSFPYKNGIGGTAVQAALALSQVGCPSIVHLTDDSKEVCELLETPYVYTISPEGELIHTENMKQTNEQEIHGIIQFKKGDKVRLGDQTVEIPCSNRLILTKITVNEFVPFSKAYFEWIEKNAEYVHSNVLSSFNALFNESILAERLNYAKDHIRKYRQANPKGIVFFEDAHYHSIDVRRLCLETLCPYVDILSLNEEELKYTLSEMYHFDIDINNIISCIKGGKFIIDKYRIQKGIIIHTKDYSMYLGKKLEADIEMGLMFGNMLATAKAQNGWYGTKEQIKKVLDLSLSPKGIAYYETVKESEYANEVTLVPSKYIDKPKYTIGLGDSFIGGVQICF